jgi:hypothetical protein
MWASRVEVGDGLPFGSEHAQYLVEIRRLRAEIERRDAEIERRDAEIERLLARDAPMMAEIRSPMAGNEVLLRERAGRRDAEGEREGTAPDGPTDVAVDIPAVGAGFGDGGLETGHAGNLAAITNDAMVDEDAGGKERSHVHLLAEIRRQTVEIEHLQARLHAP